MESSWSSIRLAHAASGAVKAFETLLRLRALARQPGPEGGRRTRARPRRGASNDSPAPKGASNESPAPKGGVERQPGAFGQLIYIAQTRR